MTVKYLLKTFETSLSCDEIFSGKFNRYVHLIASLIPILFLWFHYHYILDSWWMGDDPVILWFTIEKGIFSHFYRPDVWRSFSPVNLTPWIPLSFGLDWHLFQLNPSGFYWHHIVSFTLVLFTAYTVLVFYFHPVLVSLVLTLFTFSVPCATVVQTLMVRHYLEGLGLALAAGYFYVRSGRSDKYGWSFVGAFFYLVAVTSKEIYVPLVVILPVLSIDSDQKKYIRLIPYIFVAGAYVLWRAYMLNFGSLLSGYQHIAQPGLNDLMMFPLAAAKIMGWNQLWQKTVVAMGCLCILIINHEHLFCTYAKLGLWFIIIFTPIVPVMCILDARYLFLPAFMFFVFIGYNIRNLWNRKTYRMVSRMLSVCLVAFLFISMIQTTNPAYYLNYKKSEDRFRKEGEFILYGSDAQSSLLNPVGPPWYYAGLKWLRKNVLNNSSGPTICFDSYFCNTINHLKVYQYIDNDLIQIEWPDIKYDDSRINNSADLFFEISYSFGKLYWNFGPYTEGVYKLITQDTLNNIFGHSLQLPSKRTISLQLQTPLNLQLQYESPDGWKTISPVMILDPLAVDASGVAYIQWARN